MRLGRRIQTAANKSAPITEQLVSLRDQIVDRRKEAAELDALSASLSSVDPEKSIESDVRARATERLVTRLEAEFSNLLARAKAERVKERRAQIDGMIEAERAEVERFCAKLQVAATAFVAARSVLESLSPGLVSEATPWMIRGEMLVKKLVVERFQESDVRDLVAMGRSTYDGTLRRLHSQLLREAEGEEIRTTMTRDAFTLLMSLGSRLPAWSADIELPDPPETPEPAGDLALEGGAL